MRHTQRRSYHQLYDELCRKSVAWEVKAALADQLADRIIGLQNTILQRPGSTPLAGEWIGIVALARIVKG